jgi:tRNA A-37 threonylcarbamoyl transferase component Bud32
VRGVQALSQAGILHNDLELQNIVRSKDDPNRAKIIDLGRAKFSDDEERLSEQVEDAKALLGIGEKCNQSTTAEGGV